MTRRVELEVAGDEHDRPLRRRRADQRTQVRDEDDERERLGQEVVGAGVEGLGVIELAVLGREHEDRRPDVGSAELGTHLVAVAARQHDVEDDGVVVHLACEPQAFVAVERDVDGEAVPFEPASERTGERLLVLDDQHCSSGAPSLPSRTTAPVPACGSTAARRRRGRLESEPADGTDALGEPQVQRRHDEEVDAPSS